MARNIFKMGKKTDLTEREILIDYFRKNNRVKYNYKKIKYKFVNNC
jgi:hypothetical protein